jgi:hypothetical protein
MTIYSETFRIAMDGLKAVHGVPVSYTEIGGATQAVTALSEDQSVDGDTITKTFEFKDSDLVVVNWIGAKIVDADLNVFTVQEKEDSGGRIQFRGIRALERS